ncbi:hypothetical protein KC347_g189 [Hortaea werneckii]|nr:hypothetical protein KC347_g189 [Hortaea werneckii]
MGALAVPLLSEEGIGVESSSEVWELAVVRTITTVVGAVTVDTLPLRLCVTVTVSVVVYSLNARGHSSLDGYSLTVIVDILHIALLARSTRRYHSEDSYYILHRRYTRPPHFHKSRRQDNILRLRILPHIVSWALKVSRKQLPSKEAICLGFVVPMRRYWCAHELQKAVAVILSKVPIVQKELLALVIPAHLPNATRRMMVYLCMLSPRYVLICNIPGSVNVVQRQAYQRCTEKMVNCCGTPREAGWLPVVSTNLMSVYDGISSGALASFERKREAG